MAKKYNNAPQFELPGTAGVFNLRGEVASQPQPRPERREDLTAELFVDHCAVELGRRIIAGEMDFK